ncbi:hypothetical protein EOD23_00970 [Mesorhizobium sp. USDA-HM6]|nr:hypothetical protein EOD23_00970 [Mesorhizobium sp. USDA-HM6]
MKLLATAYIPAEALGEAPLARRGELFEANDDEASRLIEVGLAVRVGSPEAALLRDARIVLAGKNHD